jgi:hypothetical protein
MKLFFATPLISFHGCTGPAEAPSFQTSPAPHHCPTATSSHSPSTTSPPGFAAVDRMAETKR